MSALKSANNLKSNNIRAGKPLLIPLGGKSKVIAAQPHSNTLVKENQNNGKIIHRVKRGDTLWGIAKRYDVHVKQLLTWNKLPRNQILKLNQSLVLFP